MSADDDIAWLKALDDNLWPPGHKNDIVAYRASRLLTHEEFTRVEALIEGLPLVAVMFSANMFGAYGMFLYTHETYPGTGPNHVLTLIEGHFPNPLWSERPTLYERVANPDLQTKGPSKRVPGSGRDDMWELFSKYTHAPQNSEWVASYKKHGLQPPRDRSHYDY